MPAVWRLLVDAPLDGPLNMAIDRAVQVAHAQGSSPPTLRLYSWNRPTVTLGRFQDVASVDLEYCAKEGIDVVRRHTGGRGVLHSDELTYSVVAGVADGVPRGVAKSYRHLCSALVRSFQLLGVDASVTRVDHKPVPSGACYLQTTRADVVARGEKLSGSAQVWLGETVLQHGSFVIGRDCAREAAVFRLDPDQVRAIESSTTLLQATGVRPTPDQIVSAVCQGFGEALAITLRPGTLSMDELRYASALRVPALTSTGAAEG